MAERTLYDDGTITCTEDAIRIAHYYPWGAAKVIPYAEIREVRPLDLTPLRGRWRIWGSGDFRHWYNLDARRPTKRAGIEICTGRWVRPTITPDDPDAVRAVLSGHVKR